MPTSHTYASIYDLGTSPPDSGTTTDFEVTGLTFNLEDTLDGASDGQTAVGGHINWTGFGLVTLVGFTSWGDPVVLFNTVYYVFSDTTGLPDGTNIGFTTSGVYLYCFAAGTLISTGSAMKPVETLRIGDTVRTASGKEVPVKWIGRQTVSTLFSPAERLMPVRFAAGSLGHNVPHSDLTVTADHAMLIDGVLCHAGALANGTTITRVPLAEMGERYTVYHIETDAHEIILANGTPAETFIDNVSRRAFDNFDEFEALFGDVPELEELPYPRAMSARQVPQSIKRRLGLRHSACA